MAHVLGKEFKSSLVQQFRYSWWLYVNTIREIGVFSLLTLFHNEPTSELTFFLLDDSFGSWCVVDDKNQNQQPLLLRSLEGPKLPRFCRDLDKQENAWRMEVYSMWDCVMCSQTVYNGGDVRSSPEFRKAIRSLSSAQIVNCWDWSSLSRKWCGLVFATIWTRLNRSLEQLKVWSGVSGVRKRYGYWYTPAIRLFRVVYCKLPVQWYDGKSLVQIHCVTASSVHRTPPSSKCVRLS